MSEIPKLEETSNCILCDKVTGRDGCTKSSVRARDQALADELSYGLYGDGVNANDLIRACEKVLRVLEGKE